MRILIVTGKLAADTIKDATKGLKHEVDILPLPVTVAAFITPAYAANCLGKMDLKKYDMILLPGSVNGDVTPVEEATGVPTYKGTLHASDIPTVLSMDFEYSKTISASILAKDALKERAIQEVQEAEAGWREAVSIHGGVVIGENLGVSDGLPMRVIAEIVNAPMLSIDEIKNRAIYYANQGADLIDIGMLAENAYPDKIPEIINAIRSVVDLPVSIDTLNVDEIKSSIDTGIDLILSLDEGNIDEVAPFIGEETVVLLPSNMKNGYLPKKADERVQKMEEVIESAQSLGIKKIVGDLIVEPLLIPGLLEGLKAYQMFKERNLRTPLLFGIGNAIELIDADSPGVIASLSALAREAGSNMLHIPEYSNKAKGSVNEALRASHMMFLAEKRGTVVKDLGIDLLVFKEKIDTEHTSEIDMSKVKVYQGIGETEYRPDKTGWFKIQLDRPNDMILAIFYPTGKNEPSIVVKGEDSRVIYQTIIREGLITKLDHAAYLGKELEKAFTALKSGRSYTQEDPLF